MVETDADETLSDDVKRVISSWSNMSGKYIPYSNVISSMKHELLKIDNYVHITSPIRRLVDLLNEMMFSKELLGVTMSSDAELFLAKWMNELDYINKTMRSIRKVQSDCELFYRCENDPSMLGEKHIGVFFDKIEKGDGSFTYMVYIEKFKLLTRIRTRVEVREREKREIELKKGEIVRIEMNVSGKRVE
jgi:exoribonuclease R